MWGCPFRPFYHAGKVVLAALASTTRGRASRPVRALPWREPWGVEIGLNREHRHVAGTGLGAISRLTMQKQEITTRPLSRKAQQAAERQIEIAELRDQLKPGTTVYTVLRHVSDSGMSRMIDLYYVADGEILRVTWSAAKVLELTYDRNKEALRVEGCGMDMGFHVVNALSRMVHQDSQALKHRWL